jgi:hypothetical protein
VTLLEQDKSSVPALSGKTSLIPLLICTLSPGTVVVAPGNHHSQFHPERVTYLVPVKHSPGRLGSPVCRTALSG